MIEFVAIPSVLYPTLLVFLVLVIVRHVLYPAIFSPLAKIPNAHPLAAFTSAWITWIRFNNVENRTVQEAHKRHGNVVRLGPSELSVNCVDDGIKTVYGKRFEKIPFYSFFANYGILNMFSTLQSHPHSIKKKRISNIYSKSHLLSSPDIRAISTHIIHKRILPLIANRAATNTPIDVLLLYQAAAMDMATAYFFGLPVGTNFLENDDKRQHWLEQYLRSRPRDYMFFLQHFPQLTSFFAKFGIHLVPKDRIFINDEVDAWCLNMCAGAEDLLSAVASGEEKRPGDFPVVYEQLKRITRKENMSEDPSIRLEDSVTRQKGREAADVLDVPRSRQQLEIASELMDQLIATHETFGITLLYISWELSKNPKMQDRLRSELKSLPIPLECGSTDDGIPDARTLDDLPLLHAIVMETLRLHPAVPGGQPRVTPPDSSTKIGEYNNIPPNTRASAYAWSLHRNPEVFPDPEGWHPERWLENDPSCAAYEGSDKKERWFWAFSSGGRMCIGSNYAMQMMKFILTALYTNFVSTIVDDEGIEQMDGFIAGPEGDKLILAFKPVPGEVS